MNREKRENTLLYFLEDPVVVLSRKGKVVYANPAFRARFNLELSELSGKSFSELFPGWMQEPVMERLRAMEPGKAAHHFWLRNGREVFRVSMSGITLNNRLAGAVLSLWDASRESDLRSQNLELFKVLLQDIAGRLETIQKVLPRIGGDRKIGREAAENAEELERSIQRFHEFAELMLGEVKTERVPFFPERLVKLARKSLMPLAEKRGVLLEEGFPAEPPSLLGDPSLISRVLSLLLEYMIKTAPPGEVVAVSTELLVLPTGETWLSYSVAGTGVAGLETEILEANAPVAESYAALSGEQKTLVLRLFLARRLISAMGGEISVSGDKRAGTVISFRMPADVNLGQTED